MRLPRPARGSLDQSMIPLAPADTREVGGAARSVNTSSIPGADEHVGDRCPFALAAHQPPLFSGFDGRVLAIDRPTLAPRHFFFSSKSRSRV